MNSNDIRLRTKLIVRRGSEFLVGRDMLGIMKWSTSPFEAWGTRSRNDAEDVARMVGGDLWLFNNIVGEAVKLDEIQGNHGKPKREGKNSATYD